MGSGYESDVVEGRVGELLAGRFVLMVGLAGDGRVPYATRGWGLRVLSGQPTRIRLILPSEDRSHVSAEPDRNAIAVLVGDPKTVQAVQLKGWVESVEAAEPDDLATVDHYRESFFSVIEEVDGSDPRLLERLLPPAFFACTVVLDAVYDQTPGPGAGGPIGQGVR